MSTPAKSYKDTIFLPDTTFPMRGDLTTKEPARLEKWETEKLYERITTRRKAQNAPLFVLHDGPPFANGDVHMGTALNKVLKDLIVKSKTMSGYYAPFIPGWDCHGLPIEAKVVKEAQGLEPAEIRRRCTEFALGYLDQQRLSFRRLGVFGDWYAPYITMQPEYECWILRLFAKLVESGSVYQSLKPVQWSYAHHTALAEAEVEYMEDTATSVFVAFRLDEPVQGVPCEMVIWTTTPWTLPSNLAIALHPDFTYVVARYTKDGAERNLVVVRELMETFTAKTGWTPVEELATFKGAELERKTARHPFLNRESLIINAEYVTTDAGTGAVHIAPGHGMDDYIAGQQYGLPVLSPVDDDGKYTAECGVPALVGKHVFDSNEDVIAMLVAGERLLGREEFTHQYPHCWRSKTPIIFRAVKQFFISMEKLRPLALEQIDKTEWLPAWGRNRIYSTVESRPDWCISRQRTWGVPLPVFFDEQDQPVLSAEIVRKVADLVEENGTNIWFELSSEELCARLGLPAGLRKGKDTLDVWIDSGSSHVAVLETHPELCAPCDVYLEATDQHRGWFQSSLMLSCAWRGTAPYKKVLTHAFVVNQDRSKLSKSAQGTYQKPTNAKYFYEKYGADIVRLWVSSVDWQNEVPFGEDLFKQITDPYRRLRNTLRILLANLKGYQGGRPETLAPLDAWILERTNALIREVRSAYENYEFRKVFMAINQFCTNDLSALYIDVTKDSLYCDAADSPHRLSKQFAISRVFDTLVKLLAPVLAYTCDEAWEHAGNSGSVHEQDFPVAEPAFDAGLTATFARLQQIKSVIQVAIEAQIKAKRFNKNNEAAVLLTLPQEEDAAVVSLLEDAAFAKEFFIVADVKVQRGAELAATADKTPHCMCPRCRRYEPAVDEEGLCARCAAVMNA
ncbi:MAG: isoleucine--tRNA ligase [Akkermansia sp.]|nr:isoleucine--tRNA ligase [Akkermansia sp.]